MQEEVKYSYIKKKNVLKNYSQQSCTSRNTDVHQMKFLRLFAVTWLSWNNSLFTLPNSTWQILIRLEASTPLLYRKDSPANLTSEKTKKVDWRRKKARVGWRRRKSLKRDNRHKAFVLSKWFSLGLNHRILQPLIWSQTHEEANWQPVTIITHNIASYE